MSLSGLALLCLVLTSCFAAATAAPTQTVVSFPVDQQKVVGTLELPGDKSKPPVILLLHGFRGNRDELIIPSVKEGIFARAANAWAAEGFASLRIDFRGFGDSDGKVEDTTIEAQIKDALAAVAFLKTQDSVDASRLFVVGWSWGGAVAAGVAGRSPNPIKGVALWAPVSIPASTMAYYLGQDYIYTGLASGGRAVKAKLPEGGFIWLKTPFFEDLFAFDPVAELERYSGPVFVAVGNKDTDVKPQPEMGQILLSYHKGPGELWVHPMDHTFNAFENVVTVDALIAATAAFMEKFEK